MSNPRSSSFRDLFRKKTKSQEGVVGYETTADAFPQRTTSHAADVPASDPYAASYDKAPAGETPETDASPAQGHSRRRSRSNSKGSKRRSWSHRLGSGADETSVEPVPQVDSRHIISADLPIPPIVASMNSTRQNPHTNQVSNGLDHARAPFEGSYDDIVRQPRDDHRALNSSQLGAPTSQSYSRADGSGITSGHMRAASASSSGSTRLPIAEQYSADTYYHHDHPSSIPEYLASKPRPSSSHDRYDGISTEKEDERPYQAPIQTSSHLFGVSPKAQKSRPSTADTQQPELPIGSANGQIRKGAYAVNRSPHTSNASQDDVIHLTLRPKSSSGQQQRVTQPGFTDNAYAERPTTAPNRRFQGSQGSTSMPGGFPGDNVQDSDISYQPPMPARVSEKARSSTNKLNSTQNRQSNGNARTVASSEEDRIDPQTSPRNSQLSQPSHSRSEQSVRGKAGAIKPLSTDQATSGTPTGQRLYDGKALLVENSATQPSLEGILDLSNTEHKTHKKYYAKPVYHETIKPSVHHIQHEYIQRDVHNHYIHHRILPIVDVQVLPTKHYRHGPDGTLIEIPDPSNSGSSDQNANRPPQNWVIAETASKLPAKLSSKDGTVNPQNLVPRNFTARSFEGKQGEELKYAREDGTPVTETTWIHPPRMEEAYYLKEGEKPSDPKAIILGARKDKTAPRENGSVNGTLESNERADGSRGRPAIALHEKLAEAAVMHARAKQHANKMQNPESAKHLQQPTV